MRRAGLLAAAAAIGIVLVSASARAAEVVIATEASLTGPYAFTGVPTREGLLMALDEINAARKPDSPTVKLLIEDTAGEKGQAISLMNRFAVRDNAIIVLGPNASSEGVAVAPIANDLKVPLLSTTALADGVSKAGPWSFRTPAGPSVTIGSIAEYAVSRGIKRAALVFARDNEGQIGQKNIAKDVWTKKGVKIVAEESVLASDTDFLALLTKLNSLDIDGMFVTLVAEQSANFIIQARQAGLDPSVQIFGVPNFGSTRFLAVGGKAVEGVTFVSDYFPSAATPGNKAFVEAFQKRYNHQPDNYAALGYTALKLAYSAIEKAGPNPTRQGVRDALAAMRDVPTVLGSGKFSFDAERGSNYGTVLVTVKDGRFEALSSR